MHVSTKVIFVIMKLDYLYIEIWRKKWRTPPPPLPSPTSQLLFDPSTQDVVRIRNANKINVSYTGRTTKVSLIPLTKPSSSYFFPAWSLPKLRKKVQPSIFISYGYIRFLCLSNYRFQTFLFVVKLYLLHFIFFSHNPLMQFFFVDDGPRSFVLIRLKPVQRGKSCVVSQHLQIQTNMIADPRPSLRLHLRI